MLNNVFTIGLIFIGLLVEYKIQKKKSIMSLFLSLLIYFLVWYDFIYIIAYFGFHLPMCYQEVGDFVKCNVGYKSGEYGGIGYVTLLILILLKLAIEKSKNTYPSVSKYLSVSGISSLFLGFLFVIFLLLSFLTFFSPKFFASFSSFIALYNFFYLFFVSMFTLTVGAIGGDILILVYEILFSYKTIFRLRKWNILFGIVFCILSNVIVLKLMNSFSSVVVSVIYK